MVTANRFFLPSTGAAPATIAFDSTWNVTSAADRLYMPRELSCSVYTDLTDKVITFDSTTSQSWLVRQYVSDPIPPQYIASVGTLTGPIKCTESATGTDATGAVVVRVVGIDGVERYRKNTSFDSEFPTTAATRRMSQANLVTGTTQAGDRLVVEFGVDVVTPAVNDTVTMRFGNPANTADFANTSGLTTDLCPWFAMNYDLFLHDSLRPDRGRIRPAPFKPGLAR